VETLGLLGDPLGHGGTVLSPPGLDRLVLDLGIDAKIFQVGELVVRRPQNEARGESHDSNEGVSGRVTEPRPLEIVLVDLLGG